MLALIQRITVVCSTLHTRRWSMLPIISPHIHDISRACCCPISEVKCRWGNDWCKTTNVFYPQTQSSNIIRFGRKTMIYIFSYFIVGWWEQREALVAISFTLFNDLTNDDISRLSHDHPSLLSCDSNAS